MKKKKIGKLFKNKLADGILTKAVSEIELEVVFYASKKFRIHSFQKVLILITSTDVCIAIATRCMKNNYIIWVLLLVGGAGDSDSHHSAFNVPSIKN